MCFDGPILRRQVKTGVEVNFIDARVGDEELQGADSYSARTGAELCEGDQHPPGLPNTQLLAR